MWEDCRSDLRRGTVISGTRRRSEQQAGATLQVELRDGVVLIFLVNLQSTPLTVDDKNSVPFLVIGHRCGIAETPFALHALHAATHFHHIGVGIKGLLPPFRHDLGVPNQGGDQITVGGINAQLMVGPITHIDIPSASVVMCVGWLRARVPSPFSSIKRAPVLVNFWTRLFFNQPQTSSFTSM